MKILFSFLVFISFSLTLYSVPVEVIMQRNSKIYTNRYTTFSFKCSYQGAYSVVDFQIIKKRNIKIKSISVNTIATAVEKVRAFRVRLIAEKKGRASLDEVNIIYSTPAGDTKIIRITKPLFGTARYYISFYIWLIALLVIGLVVFLLKLKKKRDLLPQFASGPDERTEIEKYMISGQQQKIYEYIFNSYKKYLEKEFGITYSLTFREIIIELEKREKKNEIEFLKKLREIIYSRSFGDKFKQRYFINKYFELKRDTQKSKEEESTGKGSVTG